MSQLLKINSGYLPTGQIQENRVSPGKSQQDSIRSPSMDNQGLSTLPSVMLSQNNKLYYSENSTEGNFVISLKGGKSGTSADRKALPKILIPTRPALKRQSGQLPRVEDIQPTKFPHTVETVPVDAMKKADDGETINKEYTSYRNTRDSRRRLSTTNSLLTSVGSEPTSLIDRVMTDGQHSSTSPSTSNTDTTVSSEATDESVWSQWGACSVSCGTGTQERSRTCGPNCQQVESRECYLDSCHGIMRGLNFSDLNVQHEFHINDSSFNQSGVPKQTFLDTEVDACAMWSSCKDEYLQRYMSHLTELANCPCYYPFNLEHNNNVWDHNRRRYYQWVEVNSTDEKLHVYRPEAYKCIRSLLFPGAATLAAQVCCYTDNLQLVTRGRNAGTPNLISPQISWELHYKIDILPWVICKGDWTRYNRVLPPNNMLGCAENPYEEQLMQEVQEARDY